MSDAEELARKERRLLLIERLNQTEKLIGPKSTTQRGRLSEEELAAEIEKQRVLNAARRGGFSFSIHPSAWKGAFSELPTYRVLGISEGGPSEPSL